jgi:hypothetical protein
MALENLISNVAHPHFGVNPHLSPDFPPADTETEVLSPFIPVLKNVVKKRIKLLVPFSRVIVFVRVSLNHLSDTGPRQFEKPSRDGFDLQKSRFGICPEFRLVQIMNRIGNWVTPAGVNTRYQVNRLVYKPQ